MGSVLIDNFSAMKDVAAYIAGKGCRQPAGDTNTDSDGEVHTQEMESKKKFIVKTVEDIKAEKAINMIYAFVRKLAAEE